MNRSIVFTTSKPESAVYKTVQLALENESFTCVDLTTKNFLDYCPLNSHISDDFLALAEQMVQHENIILACPVYWYSVPALMKRFIDRWSDILTIRKDIGRKLHGKKLFIIACYGTYPDGYEGFELPLQKTASYMDMRYGGSLIYYTGDNPEGLSKNKMNLEKFRSYF